MAGIYLFDHEQYLVLYNCNNFRIEDVPLEQRQRPILGALNILMFLLFEIPYLPCMVVMWRHLEASCYKIMFMIGLADVLQLPIIGLMTGVFSIQGAMYCSHPGFNYFIGMCDIFFWAFESSSAVLLAFYRLLEFGFPALAETLFAGNRTWLHFVPILACSIFYGFFTISDFWNPITFYNDYNPYSGYLQAADHQYNNRVDEIHCAVLGILIPLIYVCIYALYRKQHQQVMTGMGAGEASEAAKRKRMVFIQTGVISMVNIGIGIGFFCIGFWDMGEAMTILLCNYLLILVHGIPPWVYLGANKTIRDGCKAMFRFAKPAAPKMFATPVVALTVTHAPQKQRNVAQNGTAC